MRTLSALSFLVFITHATRAKVYQSLADLPTNVAPFDFIIAGGGTAGSVVASRLSEIRRFNVLLIEAGPDNLGVLDILVPAFTTQMFASGRYYWNYTTVPQVNLNNRTLMFPRGHVLGGSSSVNAMAYTRGSSENYDMWGKVAEDRKWTWDALFPYIKRHEKWVPPVGGRDISGQFDPRVHGYNGNTRVSLFGSAISEYDRRALRNAQLQPEFPFTLDVNAGRPLGITWFQSTIGNGERSSAAAAYVGSDARKRPNLTVLLNTYVTRALPVNPSARKLDFRIIKIAPREGGVRRTLTASKEVILSSGVVGSPQILLNSGIGNTTELEAVGVKALYDAPAVGQELTDHVWMTASWSANVTAPPPVDPVAALAEWERSRTGPFTEAGIGHQILWARIPRNSSIWKEHKDLSAGPNTPHIEMQLPLQGENPIAARVILLSPHSRGSVKLRSNDPFDYPLIDQNFLNDPFDIAALKEGVRIAKKFYTGPAWDGYITGFLGPDPDILSDAEFEDLARGTALSGLHPVGTAAMSPTSKTDSKGVVDSNLNVIGVKGLRIVDSSIIPHIPAAHTQASVYILAERGVDIIRESW